MRTVSAIMRFDTAIEVTASELRVELMFPADEESAAFSELRLELARQNLFTKWTATSTSRARDSCERLHSTKPQEHAVADGDLPGVRV